MDKKFILKTLLGLGLILFGSQLFAETHFCIGLDNQSDHSVTYSQFPDDIGDFVMRAKEQRVFGDELSHSPSYKVTLTSPSTYDAIEVKPGSMIVYMGENYNPHYRVIYPGCFQS